MAPGGYSESSAPSDEVTRLALSLRAAAEARLGAAFARFEPVAVSQQVVAGMNYKLKVRVGDGSSDFVHLAVFKPLPHTGGAPELTSARGGLTLDAPLQE